MTAIRSDSGFDLYVAMKNHCIVNECGNNMIHAYTTEIFHHSTVVEPATAKAAMSSIDSTY